MSNAAADVVRIPASKEGARGVRALLLELSSLSAVGKYLIYNDDSYAGYLEAILEQDDHLFTQISGGDSVCHLRRIGDALFLNNIYVRPDHRGKGAGRALLCQSLLSWESEGILHVELDAFISNQYATAWYAALGFTERSRTDWVDLGGPTRTSTDPRLRRSPDSNGFMQLTLNGERVGTDVNGHASLTEPFVASLLGRDRFSGAVTRLAANSDRTQTVMETSVRLRAPLEKVLERLQP